MTLTGPKKLVSNIWRTKLRARGVLPTSSTVPTNVSPSQQTKISMLPKSASAIAIADWQLATILIE